MTKKRNEEGFALVYVVIVIFVLCSIAIALMSHTLRTLQAQEAMVQRMQDKYEAQGEIERLVAELEYTCIGYSENGFSSEIAAKDGALPGLIHCINEFSVPSDFNCEIVVQNSGDYIFSETIPDPVNPDETVTVYSFEIQTLPGSTDTHIFAELTIGDCSYETSSYQVTNPDYKPDATEAELFDNSLLGEETLTKHQFTISNATMLFKSYTMSVGGVS